MTTIVIRHENSYIPYGNIPLLLFSSKDDLLIVEDFYRSPNYSLGRPISFKPPSAPSK